jgi:hypothetical protein
MLSGKENDADRANRKVVKSPGQLKEKFLGQRLEPLIPLDGQRMNLSQI